MQNHKVSYTTSINNLVCCFSYIGTICTSPIILNAWHSFTVWFGHWVMSHDILYALFTGSRIFDWNGSLSKSDLFTGSGMFYSVHYLLLRLLVLQSLLLYTLYFIKLIALPIYCCFFWVAFIFLGINIDYPLISSYILKPSCFKQNTLCGCCWLVPLVVDCRWTDDNIISFWCCVCLNLDQCLKLVDSESIHVLLRSKLNFCDKNVPRLYILSSVYYFLLCEFSHLLTSNDATAYVVIKLQADVAGEHTKLSSSLMVLVSRW